jgi:hypothetical protein
MGALAAQVLDASAVSTIATGNSLTEIDRSPPESSPLSFAVFPNRGGVMAGFVAPLDFL